MEIQLYQNLEPSEDLRMRLKEQQLSLGVKVTIHHNLCYEKPLWIGDKCDLTCVKMGAYSYANSECYLDHVHTGRYCSIGCGAHIGLIEHDMDIISTSAALSLQSPFASDGVSAVPDYMAPLHRDRTSLACQVVLEHDVWVGAHTLFPKSVTVGTGSVIAAGTIVTKDIPPYSIVVNRNGHGEVIKRRFSDKICEELLELQWWQYDMPLVMKKHNLNIDSIEDTIAFLRDTDPSELPKLNDQYYYVAFNEKADQCQIIPVVADFEIY